MTNQPKTPLLGMTRQQLSEVALQLGFPKFKGGQIAKWLYEKRVDDINQMTDLSKVERARLAEEFTVGREEPIEVHKSTDGTVKCLFKGVKGRDVEAVYIPDKDRATVCVSCQAGCRMGCVFCATGRGGWQGNLTATQIINQVLSIPGSENLTNIVFMGMGEPADNIEPVLQTIEVLTAKWGLAWSPKRITVSTVGANIPNLVRLLDETKVHIAVSLHNPFAEKRARIMPAERITPIEKVLDVLRGYDFSHQRRLSVEYVMWHNDNDDLRHAARLASMLAGLDCRVNLIRYHALPSDEQQPPTTEDMERFRDFLNSRGITATIRASRGEDIEAACGQLSGSKS